MRAAVIFGLGTSPADLKAFQAGSPTEWRQGLPASSSDADVILIFGGDGTIHRHLSALVRLQLPVLIVPAGSGNDFARALNLRSTKDALRVWRDFESGTIRARAVDLGIIVPSAAPELLPLLLKLPAFSMRLTQVNGTQFSGTRLNGKDRTEEKLTLLAAFANTQFYGDGMRIAPEADFKDGKLDVCRINTLNPFKLFCMFPTVYFGRHLLMPEVEYSRVERVHVQTETPLEIYADGEFVCETPAEISIAAGALRVIYSSR